MKGFLSEQEYQKQLEKVQNTNASTERKIALKKEKNKYKFKLSLPSTSKLIALYLFILLNVVLAYAMYAMWHFQDLQYLGVLITDVVAQILTYYIYSKKALAENTSQGITYELAMLQKHHELTSSEQETDNDTKG